MLFIMDKIKKTKKKGKKMEIIKFIKDYWTQIVFIIGWMIGFLKIIMDNKKATLCSLRNDILEIWDKCKDTKQITRYQLEAYTNSRDLYFKKGGDGFVHALDQKIMQFEIID